VGLVAKRVTHTAFDAMHPAVPALYACITLGLTMAALHPVLVAISCAGAFAYIACVRGLRSAVCALRWQIPVMLVIALVNPLFVRMGSTVVLELFGRPVFLESLLYGLAMAGMFVASVQWFAACSHMLTHDKVLALFGSAAPVVALMISMTMRLVPRFLRQGCTIAVVQDVARSCFVADGRAGLPARVADRLRQSSVLMGWAMEDSLETADAMRARGWGARRRRTTYVPYRFTLCDAAAIVLLVLGGAAVAWVAWRVTAPFAFYPQMSPITLWWGYGAYAAWMLVPALLHIYETRRFA
jgi:energy-coupling factor transport system permease protein